MRDRHRASIFQRNRPNNHGSLEQRLTFVGRTLEELMASNRGRDNNFNLLRFFAAFAVVLAHSFAMYDVRDQYDPLWIAFGTGLGDFAVNVFFVTSGFLIAKSWSQRRSLLPFAWARAVRILPALWLSTLLLVIVAGIAFSPLPLRDFMTLPSTGIYVLKNLTMLPGSGAELRLPLAIDGWAGEFNVPLWTLPHEIQMYALLAVLGLIGAADRKWVGLTIALAALLAWVAADAGYIGASSRYRLAFHFFAGVSFLNFARHLRVDLLSIVVCIAALIVSVAFLEPTMRNYMLALTTPFLVLWLAYVPRGVARLYNRAGDYSYGTYIWAYPIQAALYGHIRSVWLHLAVAMAVTIVIAALSWHLVEERALRIPLPRWLRQRGAVQMAQ
jgi:peptidoglycan/LPS O-acetylase OafA/YrhL